MNIFLEIEKMPYVTVKPATPLPPTTNIGQKMTIRIEMTQEQANELTTLAKQDAILWQQLRLREIELERNFKIARENNTWPDLSESHHLFPPALKPSFSELINHLVTAHCDPNVNFEKMTLAITIRTHLREELNLPAQHV